MVIAIDEGLWDEESEGEPHPASAAPVGERLEALRAIGSPVVGLHRRSRM